MNADRPITREFLRQFRRVTIMGLGLFGGGAGAARYFAELGADVTVTDLADPGKLAKSISSLEGLGIRFVLGQHLAADFTDTDLVVANQAVRPDNTYLAAARKAGVPVTTETGIALSLNRSPWLAVTGSSGKSTTSALIAAMLRAHDPDTLFGGNIGGDLMTRVEGRPAASPLVVELSSYQLTYLAHDFAAGRIASPAVAAVTNLAANHLDWHADMREYVEAKHNLIRFQTPDEKAVLNVDDARLREWAREAPSGVVRCALADPGGPDACFVGGGAARLRLAGRPAVELPLRLLRLPGRHNIQNALEAVAAAFVMCRDAKAVRAGFSSFAGLPHRLETVAEVAGRTFVNDSKSTTPEAAILALEAFDAPRVLIAGGYDKQSPFQKLGTAIQEMADGLVLVGDAARRIRMAVEAAPERRPAGRGPLPIVEAGGDFRRAVVEAFRLTPVGGVVLLSPACASWGMFTNYEERGAMFREIAATLAETEP